jgi:hypothetical protein
MRPPHAVRALCLSMAGLACAGCSVIGLTVGAASDASRKAAPLPTWKVYTLKPGVPVDVQMRDGRRFVGRFSGLDPVPATEYAEAYEKARAALQGEVRLPALGPARLDEASGKRRQVELLGFGPGCAFLRRKEGAEPTRVPSAQISTLTDAAGVSIGTTKIDTWTNSGRLPLMEVFALTGAPLEATAPPLNKKYKDGGPDQRTGLRLPLEEIATIEWLRPGGNTTKGFLIGAAVDAAVIGIVALASASDSGGGGGGSCTAVSCESSCPYFYSWDGSRYVLDAEPFAGSFVEVAQRSDWSRLDHLREANGTYRLRVANELQEEDHLDAVKLLVVDHAEGTEVVPDLNGGVHVLASPVAPETARDGRGADVRGLLARADGRAWLASPFGRDPGTASDLRDGVILDFQRPAGASEATLAVTARSTTWAPGLVHELLSLKGRDLERWYQQVNANVFGHTLDELTIEAVPTVKVWDGRQWKFVELLAALPTATTAVQAFPLDLRPLPPGSLRLRIDGLPGSWELDYAAVDYGGSPKPVVTRIAPEVARTEHGLDVRALLEAPDGRRHSMRTGDAMELRFVAPPAREGLRRTVVLEATGWYRILLPAAGEPQTARFDQLLNEPDALARFSLERIQAQARPLAKEALAN